MIVKGTKQLGYFRRGINLYTPEKQTQISPLKDGLILWLKADAGVSYTPTALTFVNQIIISNAGTNSSNGTYTRLNNSSAFYGPNNNQIYSDGGDWLLYDDDFGDITYYNNDLNLNTNNWIINLGNSPVPTAVNTNISGTYNIVNSWVDQSDSGNNATSMINHEPIFQNAATSNINKDCVYFYADASYSSFFNGMTIPGFDFDNATEFTAFVIARTLVAVSYANGNLFGQFGGEVNRKNQLTSAYMLLYGGDYHGGVDPNIGENLYGDCVLTLFGVRPNINNGQAKTTTIFKNNWYKDGTTLINAGRYDYNGQLNRGSLIGFDQKTDSDIYIGTAYGGGAENLKGEICEILYYNTSLTDSEFDSVVNYLNTKYQIY